MGERTSRRTVPENPDPTVRGQLLDEIADRTE
jgi:hypothetical protein